MKKGRKVDRDLTLSLCSNNDLIPVCLSRVIRCSVNRPIENNLSQDVDSLPKDLICRKWLNIDND